MLPGSLPRGVRGRVAPGRDAAVASLQPRGLLARRGSPGPGPQGEQELLSFISVRISIVGGELSGATRRRRGRRDGCVFLLVSFRTLASSAAKPFSQLCTTGRRRSFVSFYCFCAASFAPSKFGRAKPSSDPPSPADRQRPVRRCRRGRAEPYWSGVASRGRAAREPAHSRQGPRRASR